MRLRLRFHTLIQAARWLFLFVAALFFLPAGSAQAANYFTWGIEGNPRTATSLGTSVTNFWGAPEANTTQDCTIAHAGSCSMKITVAGNDSGNQQSGYDVIDNVSLPFNVNAIPGGSIYYRAWVRFSSGFSWGTDTGGIVKISREQNGNTLASPRMITLHSHRGMVVVAECDYADPAQNGGYGGGGCITSGGASGNDFNLPVNYSNGSIMSDGQWHEHIIRLKPNTANNSNAEFQLWIDGVSQGTLSGFRLTQFSTFGTNAFVEDWGGIWARPYFQMNGALYGGTGGTVWIDDVSTDDTYNSISSGGDTTPPAAPTGLGVE